LNDSNNLFVERVVAIYFLVLVYKMPRRNSSKSSGSRSRSRKSCWGGRRKRRITGRRGLKHTHPAQKEVQAMAMAQGQGQAQGQSGGGAPLGFSKVGADMSQGGAGAYEIATVGGNYDQQAGYFNNAYGQSVAAHGPTPFTGGQSGGRRRRGGSFGSVVGNAVVPFALLGAQNAFGRRRMTKLMRGPQRLVRGTRRALKIGGNAEKW
jgi:hypothetical protein